MWWCTIGFKTLRLSIHQLDTRLVIVTSQWSRPSHVVIPAALVHQKDAYTSEILKTALHPVEYE